MSDNEPRLARLEEWMGRAACAGANEVDFFPSTGDDQRPARAYCQRCEVRAECLEYALTFPSLAGIWGDTSEKQRHEIRRERGEVKRRFRR